MIDLSIVVTVYKSTTSLEEIVRQVEELPLAKQLTLEIIFINDSPGDQDTCHTLAALKAANSRVRVYTLRKNQGQHIAKIVGLSKATGRYIITMDDDLQHPVYEIPKLVAAMQQNPDLDAIFAITDYADRKHSLWRNAGSWLLKTMDVLFLDKPKGLIKSSYTIMTADLTQVVLNTRNATPVLSNLIINATDRVINIKVAHDHRVYGQSNYTLRKLVSLSLNNILNYSSLPLQFLGILGLGGLAFAFFFILWVIYRKLFLDLAFPGYASTVVLISFFGGLNLFGIGLIGEYLIRIIKEQQKPNLDNYLRKERNI